MRQVKREIFKLFRPIIQAPSINNLMDRNDPNFSEEAVLRSEYKKFFEDGIIENDNENIGNQLYKLQVFNNVNQQHGMFFNSRAKCELCDKDHKDNCDLDLIDERATIGQVFNKMQERNLIIVAQWRSNPQANLQLIEKPLTVDQN